MQIEGYTFSVDLNDHGMSHSLQVLAREATTLKRVMRANFEENMSIGNSYAALGQKVTDIHRTIEAYSNAISKAKEEMQNLSTGLDKAKNDYESYKEKLKDVNQLSKEQSETLRAKQELYDDTSRKVLNLINKQENYRNQISRLTRQESEARRQQELYNESLERQRSVTAGMSASISSYDRMLEQAGLKSVTTGEKVKMLNTQYKLLGRQSQLEVSQTKRLQSSLASLQREYSSNAAKLHQIANAGGQASSKYKSLASAQATLSSRISHTTADLQKQTAQSSRVAGEVLKMRSAINSVGTGRLGAVGRALTNIDARARMATSHTRAWANSMRGSFFAVSMGLTALGTGIGKSVSMAAQLQGSWVQTRNLLEKGAKSARDAREEVGQMGRMERDAQQYSLKYGYSQKQIADQYQELVKRGYSAKESIGAMGSMMQAARASGDDYGDVVKNVSSTLDAFGMRQRNVVENSKRVTNAMAYAADLTATDFKGMGEAMSYVSASAHQAGQSVETTTAAVGELSNAGIEGTRAGTGLRKMMNSLSAPTKNARAALKKYGMTFDEFKTKSGALKQIPQIMSIINNHVGKLGKSDKAAFFKAVFGTTGQQAALVLSQNAKSMQQLVDAEKKAETSNYVGQLAKKNMQTTQMQMKLLKTNVENIAIITGKQLLPAVNQVVTAFGKWSASKVGQRDLKEFANSLADVALLIGRHSSSILGFLGGFSDGLIDVAKVAGDTAKVIAWPFEQISKLTGHSGNISHFFGIITGGLVGVIGIMKILHGAISGINAVRDDMKSIGIMKDTSAQLQDQNSLYERMIQLQERSLEISEAQAKQQGINIEAVSSQSAGQEAEDIVGGIPGGGKEAKSVKINPYLDERGKSRVGNWFSKTLPIFGATGGAKAGEKASIGFLGKFRQLPGKIKSAGVFGTIANLSIVAFSAIDLSKSLVTGLTSSKAKSRYQGAGKAAAEGVAWYFGGPFAAQMAGFGMDWAYKATDSFKKGWNGYTRNYKPRGFIATVGWDFKNATREYNNWIASIEHRHPVVAAYFRWERGTITTAFASVKWLGRHIHNSFKSVWDGVYDVGHGRFKQLANDQKADHDHMMKDIKNDWKGFFGWFSKNRKKETIHKPSKNSGDHSSSTISRKPKVKSLGSAHYSSSDVKNLKAMTAQIGSYEKALKGLKSAIKTNDPTAELRHMNKELRGASTNWGKVAKPIKKIGDAFKYLSRFTRSMAKKDAFAAMNRDLPKLDTTVKKHGKTLTANISKLGKALKKNALEGPLKKLDKELKSSTKEWKAFSSPAKSLAKSFKILQSVTKSLNGKNGLTALGKGFKNLDKSLKHNGIGKQFVNLSKQIKKSKIDKAISQMTKNVRLSVKYWKRLAKPIKTTAKSFKVLSKSVKDLDGKRSGFGRLNSDIRNLYRTIRKNPFGKLIARQAKIANDALGGKKAGFVAQFNRETRSMDRALRSFRSTFDRDWKQTWRGLSRPVDRNLSEAARAESHQLDDMESKRAHFSSSFLKGWDSWIDSVVSNFRKGFSKLPNYASSAMKEIISRLNKGISGINSTISSFGGDKKLSSISYANGTQGGHPGGHMLVNDSVRPHWKELVLFPNGQALLPQHRNTLIPNAPRGTQVLSGENTYKLMNSIGVHKYANGTLSDEEMDKLSEQFEKHPEQASKELILKLTNWNSKVPVVADFGEASAVAFSRGIANKLKDLIGAVKQPVNGDWTPVIRSAAAKMGVSLSAGDISHIITVIMGESGGIQNRRQEVDDVNMREGHPAQGLLQYVPSTFDHYAVAGHHNINSGYDQLLAMFNDATWRSDLTTHGWSPNGPRRMAWGGFANKEQLIHVAEGNLPEAIIPIDINKRPRALSLIDHTLDKMESDGGGTGGLRSRASQTRVDNENATYLKQAVSILAQIAGLNKQQIDAILTHGNDDMNSRHKRAQFYQKFGNDQRVSDYMSY